jgi:benzoate-CoA ligase family protein
MQPHTVAVDRSVSPSRIRFAPEFNLCVPFVDRHLAEGRGGKIIAQGRDWQLRFGELHDAVLRMGNALRKLGIGAGDRVMLLSRDTPAFYIAFLGAIRIGAVVVPVNTFLRAADYAYMLADSAAKAVLVTDPAMAEIDEALEAPGVAVAHRIALETPREGWLELRSLLAGASAECAVEPTTAESPCFWLYSSGSTGSPKASVHEHKDMVYTSEWYAVRTLGVSDEDLIFSAPKLFFAYGIGNSFSFPLWTGCTAVLLEDRPTAENTLAIIETFQPTLYFGVPTLYAAQVALLGKRKEADPQQPSISIERMRFCLSGGEPLPPAVLEQWNRLTGISVLDGIGSSEGLHIYAQNMPGATKIGSAGRAVNGYRLRVLDRDGNEAPVNEPGELVIQGESFAKFYWNKPEKTRDSWTAGGWFRSGDTMYRDEDGYYFFCGRGDDMLKVGGIWVSPFEIESALAAHPGVIEAAVIGAPDEHGLIKPKGFCVLREPGQAGPALEAELIGFIRQRLAPFKYPRWIEFIDELPKTASGKIQRFRLRDR